MGGKLLDQSATTDYFSGINIDIKSNSHKGYSQDPKKYYYVLKTGAGETIEAKSK
jgi:hypothetical protein